MKRLQISVVLVLALSALVLSGCESTGDGGGSGAGGADEAIWAAAGSDWPANPGGLGGPNPVRLINRNDFDIRVGLRTPGLGTDLVVRAGETATVTVPDGRYDIYFQYAVAPRGVYRGDPFTLQGNGYEIQILRAPEGSPGLRRINN